MGNWLLDGTWSLGQVRHSEFRKKLKGENDHKVKKKVENTKVAQTGAEGDNWSFYKRWSETWLSNFHDQERVYCFYEQFQNFPSPEDGLFHSG